jgi:hypothetical protein
MKTENNNPRQHTTLDFSNPAHSALFFNHFGGEQHIQKNYPKLFTSYQNATKLPPTTSPDNTPPGFINRAHIIEFSIDPQSKSFFSNGTTVLTTTSNIHMVIEIYINDEIKGRDFKSFVQSQSGSLDCTSEAIPSFSAKDKAVAILTSYWTNNEQSLLYGASMTEQLNYDGDECISSIDCLNPKKNSSMYPDKIRISYGRYPKIKEPIDYAYSDSRDKSGNQKLLLDVNGNVTLKSGYTFDSLKSYDLSLSSVERGAIVYQAAPPECTKTSPGFDWSFSNDWLDSIPDSVRYGTEQYYLDLRIYFTCKDSAGNIYLQNIDVTSFNHQNLKSNIKQIPPLELLWGCLAKDTPIKMSDSSEKPISEIKIGDIIATPSGATTVTNIFSGHQDDIYIIRTAAGKEIHATADHPMMTSQGFVRASDLTSLTPLQTENGDFVEATDCYPAPYNDTVYSLDLDGSDAFFASGFVSGTFSIQNKDLTAAATTTTTETDLTEFKQIASDMAKRTQQS